MQKVRAAVKVVEATSLAFPRGSQPILGSRRCVAKAIAPGRRRLSSCRARQSRFGARRSPPDGTVPRGPLRIVWSRKGIIGTSLPELQDVHIVVKPLEFDAVLQADRGNIDAAIRSCNGIFNCCRIIHDDPLILSQLIRNPIASIGVTTLERILAQGEADGVALQRLQTVIAAEAAPPAVDHRGAGVRAVVSIGSSARWQPETRPRQILRRPEFRPFPRDIEAIVERPEHTVNSCRVAAADDALG